MRYLILTKLRHVKKIVNFLNDFTDIDYSVTCDKHELYSYDYDIGVSYCFPYVIDVDDVRFKNKRFYNYHPAPLPEYKGSYVYGDAVRDRVAGWGVSLHIMTNKVDSGRVIKRYDFKLNSIPVCTEELGDIAHYWLFQLFKSTIVKLGFNEGKL